MTTRKQPKPTYAQLLTLLEQRTEERDQALRMLNVLGLDASVAQLQGNPAPMERIRQAEQGEEYHVSPNQLTLPL